MVNKILIPTDGSAPSEVALDYAIERAKMSDSELLIMNVIRTSLVDAVRYELSSKDNVGGQHLKDKYLSEEKDRRENILDKAIKKAEEHGVKAEGIVKIGAPDKEIMALTIDRDDIELVVMGAYGRNYLERQLVGSKTEGVLRGLPAIGRPLVIVPVSSTEITGNWILVPMDGSEPSDKALDYAIERAKMSDKELLIFNTIRSDMPTSYHGVSAKRGMLKEQEASAKRIIDRGVNYAKGKGVSATGLIRRGDPDKEVIGLAKELDDISLIIMGAYGKNFLERQLVGSKTEKVLRAVPAIEKPLVVVCDC